MSREAVVTSKGQLVIPADIRKRYRIRRGTRVRIEEVEQGILVRPMTEDAIDRLCGILEGKGLPARIDRDPDREL
jgi:AbrB family looped-hinge helix DNA binding protein